MDLRLFQDMVSMPPGGSNSSHNIPKEGAEEAARKGAEKSDKAKKVEDDQTQAKSLNFEKISKWLVNQTGAKALEEFQEQPEEEGDISERLAESGDDEVSEGAARKAGGEKAAKKKKGACKSAKHKKLARSRKATAPSAISKNEREKKSDRTEKENVSDRPATTNLPKESASPKSKAAPKKATESHLEKASDPKTSKSDPKTSPDKTKNTPTETKSHTQSHLEKSSPAPSEKASVPNQGANVKEAPQSKSKTQSASSKELHPANKETPTKEKQATSTKEKVTTSKPQENLKQEKSSTPQKANIQQEKPAQQKQTTDAHQTLKQASPTKEKPVQEKAIQEKPTTHLQKAPKKTVLPQQVNKGAEAPEQASENTFQNVKNANTQQEVKSSKGSAEIETGLSSSQVVQDVSGDRSESDGGDQESSASLVQSQSDKKANHDDEISKEKLTSMIHTHLDHIVKDHLSGEDLEASFHSDLIERDDFFKANPPPYKEASIDDFLRKVQAEKGKQEPDEDLELEGEKPTPITKDVVEGLRKANGYSADDDKPDLGTHHHLNHSNNPFAKKGSGKTSSDTKTDAKKGDGFFLFSEHYDLRKTNVFAAETEATQATYKENQIRSKVDAHKEMLELHAEACQQYTSDYMQGVEGIKLHIFDGTCSFTSDLQPNIPTPAYKEWLHQTANVRDQYIGAKTQMQFIKGEESALHVRYAMLYDQTEMSNQLVNQVLLSYSMVDFDGFHEKIHKIEDEIASKEKKCAGTFSSLIERITVDHLNIAKAALHDDELDGHDPRAIATAKEQVEHYQKEIDLVEKIQEEWKSINNNKKNFDMPKMMSHIHELMQDFKNSSPTDYAETQSIIKGVDSCKKLFKQRIALRDALKVEILHFFTKVNDLINAQKAKVEKQKSEFAGDLGHTSAKNNPFNEKLHFLNNLQHILKTSENKKSHQDLKGVWGEAKKMKKAFIKAFQKNVTSTAWKEFAAASKAWKTAKSELAKDQKIVSKYKGAFSKQKKCPIPLDKRWASTSFYGYAIINLEEYRRTMDVLNSASGTFNSYSQQIFSPPKRVDTAAVMPVYKSIANYEKQKVQDQTDLTSAKSAVIGLSATLAFVTIFAPYLIPAATAGLTIAILRRNNLEKKIKNLTDNLIPGAKASYQHLKFSLPMMQLHRDDLWRSGIRSKAAQISAQLSRQKDATIRKEHEAMRGMKTQESNMQKFIRTMDKIPDPSKGAAKTQSFS